MHPPVWWQEMMEHSPLIFCLACCSSVLMLTLVLVNSWILHFIASLIVLWVLSLCYHYHTAGFLLFWMEKIPRVFRSNFRIFQVLSVIVRNRIRNNLVRNSYQIATKHNWVQSMSVDWMNLQSTEVTSMQYSRYSAKTSVNWLIVPKIPSLT